MLPLNDFYTQTLTPVFRFKPQFCMRTGIFSPVERFIQENKVTSKKAVEINGKRKPEFYRHFLNKISHTKIAFELLNHNSNPPLSEASLVNDIGDNIINDLSLLSRDNFNSSKLSIPLEGSADDLWIHNDAICSKSCSIDTRNGPVIIDEGSEVSAFSLIKGPAYIGKFSKLDKVFLENSTVGVHNRLGGEISNSYFGDYTNKHHEGFVGHSIIGDWANLGALTTTSDLKNNYGMVKLEIENKLHDTGVIKFGSIIGDFVKTSIGTMLNTGTIIDVGSLLFHGRKEQKYYQPFYWGGENESKYELDRFLNDMQLIMKRRKQQPDDFLLAQIKELY